MPTELSPAGFAANTAAPQPPTTSQNVPMNSAARRLAVVGAVTEVPFTRK